MKEVIDELVGDLRREACKADRAEAGCDLAVLLCYAERMIVLLASRAPGPATLAMVAELRIPIASVREFERLRAAFLAEHEPAQSE